MINETKEFIAVQWNNEKLAIEIVGIVQNALIPLSPILKRIDFIASRLKLFLAIYNETPFTELFQCALKDISPVRLKLENQKGLHSKEINLTHFLNNIDKILNFTYAPSDCSEKYPIKKLTKRITPYLFLAFGDTEDTQKEVLKLLRKWNNSQKMIAKLKENLVVLTNDSILRQNISCIENLWTEHIDNTAVFQTIDNTPYKDMIETFCRQDMPCPGKILINGQPFIVNSPTTDLIFFYKLLSKLYLAFGFEIPESEKAGQISLKDQMILLLQCLGEKGCNFNGFSDQTLICFRLLKMASIISWARADLLVREGLGHLLKGQLLLGNRDLKDEILFNFYIDKENHQNSFVVQTKTFNICPIWDYNDIKAKFPVSWKVNLPIENK
ncbi:MAG: hypothetical protein H0T62_10425 [Parachlamydiaceae bacterium]|nr:hypothetical protein [Parachlamydiaceae bacterium]